MLMKCPAHRYGSATVWVGVAIATLLEANSLAWPTILPGCSHFMECQSGTKESLPISLFAGSAAKKCQFDRQLAAAATPLGSRFDIVEN